MKPAQISAARNGTKLCIHHAVVLQHIPDRLPVGRQIIGNNTQFHLIQEFHALYPGIAQHTEKSFIDKNGPHLPVLILEEADSRYDIVNHRSKVFNA